MKFSKRWGVVKSGRKCIPAAKSRSLIYVEFDAALTAVKALTSDIEAARSLLPAEAVIDNASLEDIVVLLQAEERSCSL